MRPPIHKGRLPRRGIAKLHHFGKPTRLMSRQINRDSHGRPLTHVGGPRRVIAPVRPSDERIVLVTLDACITAASQKIAGGDRHMASLE